MFNIEALKEFLANRTPEEIERDKEFLKNMNVVEWFNK